MMTSFEFQLEYMVCGTMTFDEFIDAHASHEIIECDDGALLQVPLSPEELRLICGEQCEAEYLGEDSPFYLDNDGLFFSIRPVVESGKSNERDPIHVVVYVV